MAQRRILQVKYGDTDGKITIVYQKSARGGVWDKNTMSSSDEPSGAFTRAIDALAPFVLEILDMPGSMLSTVDVIGVSLKFSKHGDIRTAHILARRTLSNTNSVIKLKVPINFALCGRGYQPMIERWTAAIMAVIEFADGFLDGEHRAQPSLFDESPTSRDDDDASGNPPAAPAGDPSPADEGTADEAGGTPALPGPTPDDTYRYLFAQAEEPASATGEEGAADDADAAQEDEARDDAA